MRDYLGTISRICPAPGSAAWPETVPIPQYINAAMAEYHPGGSSIGTILRTAEAALLRPIVLAVLGSLLLVIVMFMAATGKVLV
jgi:hypothetical protein